MNCNKLIEYLKKRIGAYLLDSCGDNVIIIIIIIIIVNVLMERVKLETSNSVYGYTWQVPSQA